MKILSQITSSIVMIEDGYLTQEECQTFEFVHDRDVEDYERIMSETLMSMRTMVITITRMMMTIH